jgi:translation initiation factor 2 subunit 1
VKLISAQRSDWPEVGDLVVASVIRIVGHGAYVSLDEYDNKEGLLHISEISSSWVRNIRNHVRERQKVVLQVLRVDPSREQVDLSLRRVTQDDKRKKIEDWKKNRKAETLLRNVASMLKMEEEDVYKRAGVKIIDHFGSLYAGFEVAAERGFEAITEAGIPKKYARAMEKIAKEKITVKSVTIHGLFEINSMESDGVVRIRDTLLETRKVAADNGAQANLFSLGAPKYRIEVTAPDYRMAEVALGKIVDFATRAWGEQDGDISFTRE